MQTFVFAAAAAAKDSPGGDEEDEVDPAPTAPAAPPSVPAAAAAAHTAAPAAMSDDESDSDVCDEDAFIADPGWRPHNRRTVLEHDAARADIDDKRFHREVRGGPTTTLDPDEPEVRCFQEQFTPAIQTLIVDQTNLYAAQFITNANTYYASSNARVNEDDEHVMRDWKQLTRDQLMKFTGVLIYMASSGSARTMDEHYINSI